MRKTQRKIISMSYCILKITSPMIHELTTVDRSFLKQFKTFAVRVLSDLNKAGERGAGGGAKYMGPGVFRGARKSR
jgi:hypothetical protein